MNPQRLVAMANDIANYFDAEPDRELAIAGVANHLVKFWDPVMRAQLVGHAAREGAGLSDLARAAVARLAASG